MWQIHLILTIQNVNIDIENGTLYVDFNMLYMTKEYVPVFVMFIHLKSPLLYNIGKVQKKIQEYQNVFIINFNSSVI